MTKTFEVQQSKAEQYEKLVFLCEQAEWSSLDADERSAITDLVKEIGTVEAALITAAFEGRHRSTRTVRSIYEVLRNYEQR